MDHGVNHSNVEIVNKVGVHKVTYHVNLHHPPSPTTEQLPDVYYQCINYGIKRGGG